MRFNRYVRHCYNWSRRKELALLRRQRFEQEAYPLFAEDIRVSQPSVDQVRQSRIIQAMHSERDSRQRLALAWKAARKQLEMVNPQDRAQLLHYWNTHPHFPGTPIYLSYVLRQYHIGGLGSVGRT